jgi:cation diffusion facilitator family transporter
MVMAIKNQQGFFVSAIIALLFAVVGLVIGFIVDSQMILFDGLYSLISFGLSAISLMASNFMQQADSKKYPFGAANLEAMVIIFKFVVILVVIIVSIVFATNTILNGGNQPVFSVGVIYAFVSIFICWAMSIYLKRKAIKTQNALLLAEADQWIFDTITSFSVFLSFLVAIIFIRLDIFTSWVVWIDPALVVITGVYLLKTPIQSIIKQTKFLLEEAPNQKVMNQLSFIMKDIEVKYQLQETFVRATMGNGKLWLEIDLVVSTLSKVYCIEDQDRIREEINQKIERIPSQKWLTISFMKDRKWAM